MNILCGDETEKEMFYSSRDIDRARERDDEKRWKEAKCWFGEKVVVVVVRSNGERKRERTAGIMLICNQPFFFHIELN